MQIIYRNKFPLILATMLVIYGCEKAEEPPEELYETASVVRRTIDISVEASGVIEPETTVEVKSKASGEILAVNAETGDQVDEGTLLVQIDKKTPRNLADQAQADLQAAISRRQIATTQLQRTKNLLEKGIVTETEYETGQLELANAEALVISKQVELENAKISLDDTDIKAPISGTIILKSVERGQVISSPTRDVGGGTVLLKMANLDTVQVRTMVDETDIGKIKPGLPVTVSVSAFPNQPFSGNVLKIEPQATVDQNVTMFPVLIRLQNQSGLLLPGMNAGVKINIARAENVLAVPTMALRVDRDISTTAAILNMTDSEIRQQISAAGKTDTIETTSSPADPVTISIGDREIQIPEGIDPELVRSGMAKRRNNETLTGEEKEAVQIVLQARNGGRENSSIDRPEQESMSAERRSSVDYQFGGTYWVVVAKNGVLTPRPVKTGITDMEYSQIISGLAENDQILVLPSSGLVEQQERMQNRLNQRMRLPGTGSNNSQPGR